MNKAALITLSLMITALVVVFFSSSALAGDQYQKKGYYDPPEIGDQIYKLDPESGWVKDQACVLCHIDRPPNPPYKEWDWKDKYGLNRNGKIFRDSNSQRLLVPGISPLADYLPEQTIDFRLKEHEGGTSVVGEGVVERDGKYYRVQWAELEEVKPPSDWYLTPGYKFKELKFKELFIKFDSATGKGEHYAKLDLTGEVEVVVDGKKVKNEIKFDGDVVGTNSGPDGRIFKGLIWTIGPKGKSAEPDDYYYDSARFVNRTPKTFIAEYRVEMDSPLVINDPGKGLVVNKNSKGQVKIYNATWSTEYLKNWAGTSIHRTFAEDTMKCAACHSTHRSSGEKLINRRTETMLCALCHDGTGSPYNVRGGLINNTYESPAGPIDKWPISLSSVPGQEGTEVKATSRHEMKYTTVISAAPGGSGAWSGELRCTSCHNPHGSTNYRSLRATPNPNNWNNYGGSNRVRVIADIKYAGGKVGTAETVDYKTGMTEFCSSCHVDYQSASESGVENYFGNPAFGSGVQEEEMYGVRRHANYVDGNDNVKFPFTGTEKISVNGVSYPLKFETAQRVPDVFGGGKKDKPAIACITCHFGHGTTISESNSEEATIGGNKDWYIKGLGMTALLRVPGRGVCMACHRASLMERP